MESLICARFCSFYKPGRTKPEKCGTFEFLRRNLTPEEIRLASENTPGDPDRSADGEIEELVCSVCGFRIDGCDFRAGEGDMPCGGYAVLTYLLNNRGRT